MKKIAYISVYKDGTGYGNAAVSMIKALDSAGFDVVPIWITLNKFPFKQDSKIAELEKKNLNNVDVVIQQCLPDMFVRVEGVKNIGYFFWETDDFTGSGWKSGCELMDEIWVTTEAQKQACISSGIKESIIRIIDQPKEIISVDEKLDFNSYGIAETFKFYTISDYSNKKNVNALVHAFLTEFTVYDNVSFVIKSYMSGRLAEDSKNHMKMMIQELKKQIGKKQEVYPKIAIISHMISDEELAKLENGCDCFISASRGEGEGLPMVQAALRGKPVIASNISGISKNFINQTLLVKNTVKKKVFGMNSGHCYFWSENWEDPSTSELCEKMRFVIDNPNLVKKIVSENKIYIEENFSIDSCAAKLKEVL